MNRNFDINTTNIHNTCNICGEKDFQECDGHYYCLECGTKQDHICVIEVDADASFRPGVRYVTKRTIKKAKKEPSKFYEQLFMEITLFLTFMHENNLSVKLSSWECYNYILHGLVHELLLLGAKNNLKLVTLQVWAAFLKTIEVAFFNKTHISLPKLGMHYHKM